MATSVLICQSCGFATTCRELGDLCPTDDTLLLPRQSLGERRRDPSVGRLLAGRFLVLGGQVRHDALTIYRGRDLVTGDAVSIKTVPPYGVDADERVARLTAESRLLRREQHATLPVFVAGGRESDGLVWLVYGGMRGVSLRALLTERGTIRPNRAINIALRILAALDRLHRRERVHGGLRPENILITPRGLRGNDEIRLLDLGRTTAFGAPGALRATDDGLPYRPPEQRDGMSGGVWTDVYSVGALLFEMLTGHPPGDASPFARLRPTVQGAISRIDSIAEFEALAGVVERALQPDAGRRWQRARAMAIALKAAFVTRGDERVVQSSAPAAVRPPESGPLPRCTARIDSPRLEARDALEGLTAFG